ncbi:sensor histidine kinase [Streptomyces sp. XD-27]|uniref:sensor histidine kinase n=1 Tax=Streptomyces sp. XD-27 TaxID=3062779 RepID=UPI0026F413BC|nr:histidine kinase [Streptomyces sp. XD-27]WKX72634.1 histidine kinase [Streptomyces sp. XD-27]
MPPLPLPRPSREEVLISAAGLLGGLLLWKLGLASTGLLPVLPGWLALVALALMSGAELLRRTAPCAGLAIGSLAFGIDLCAGSLIANVAMFTDLLYAAVLYGPPVAARFLPRATEVFSVLAAAVPLALLREPEALLIGVAAAVVTATPAYTGLIVRNHREAADAARLRAEQTALLAEMDRTQAVTAERARMARELHDMVANHLSAIAIHSTAALSIKDPAASQEALGVIRENSVQGLAEMRRLIGLLRDAGAGTEPAAAPTLDGLDALLRQARTTGEASGLRFRLRDERPEGSARLPAPVELAAYRIVQEALTNALKHAAPGEVLVELAREGDAARDRPTARATDGRGPLRVRVTTRFGDRPGPRAPGSGAGLVGMRERVALLRGEFEAGPVTGPDGRIWEVRAVLPVEEGDDRT